MCVLFTKMALFWVTVFAFTMQMAVCYCGTWPLDQTSMISFSLVFRSSRIIRYRCRLTPEKVMGRGVTKYISWRMNQVSEMAASEFISTWPLHAILLYCQQMGDKVRCLVKACSGWKLTVRSRGARASLLQQSKNIFSLSSASFIPGFVTWTGFLY